MVKIEEFKILIAVAEAGNFVGAADRLGIAPSVISRTVKALESRLNTTLFNRTTRKISITNEGRWLLTRAKETIGTLEGIYSHFTDDTASPEGRLTIDAATPFALHAISPIISKFIERYPKIEICIDSNETITDLIDNRVDLAIRVGPLKDSTLKAKKLGVTTRSLYASPDYLKKYGSPSSAEDLKNHKCLGFSKPASLNVWPLLTGDGEWLEIKPHMLASSGETLKQLSVYGNGILCVSNFVVREELNRGALVPVLGGMIEQHTIPIFAVFYSEHMVGGPIRSFLDFLDEHPLF